MKVKGLSPQTESIFKDISKLNCIKDYCMIGGTALAMQYRTTHRDYYDIYSLLKEGVDLDTMISRTRKYLRHNLRTREIISMLVCENLEEDRKFSELLPKYDVSIAEIRQFIVDKIKKMQISQI